MQLDVTPAEALFDEVLDIAVRGVDPAARVTVTASFSFDGDPYRGTAVFVADDDGRVDVGSQAPVEGDYEGVRPMGLVQFAHRADDGSDHSGTADLDHGHRLQVTAETETGERATATVVRRSLPTDASVRRVEDHDDTLVGDLLLPPGDGPHPGVILLGGSGGGVPTGPRAKQLAAEGYAVLALAYFQPMVYGPRTDDDRPFDRLPESLSEIPLSYFERGVEWFADQEAVRSEPLAVFGGSRGSEAAVLLAARRPEVEAVVGLAPSAYVFPDPTSPKTSAWSADGEPLPHLSMPFGYWVLRQFPTIAWRQLTGSPIGFTPVFDAAVDRADSLAEARLPFEDIDGSVLLLSGGDDRLWPSKRFAEEAVSQLVDAARFHTMEQHNFEGAGHAIGVPYTPVRGRAATEEPVFFRCPLRLGGSPEGYAAADVGAWKRTTAFLADALDA